MNNKKRFNQLCKDIKSIKIQGARNVALAGLQAYKLSPTPATKSKILKLRSTEPFLLNILKQADTLTINQLKKQLKQIIPNKKPFEFIAKGFIFKKNQQLNSYGISSISIGVARKFKF